MLYGSKMWCLKENEVAILGRSETSIVRMMCGVKLVENSNTVELMDMLGLKEAADKLTKVNDESWYGHVLRQPEEDILIKIMVHKVDGKPKQGQPKDEIEQTS